MGIKLVEERAYWLAWSQVPGIGPILLKRIHQHFKSLGQAWQGDIRDLREVEGVGKQLLTAVEKMRSQLDPAEFLRQHQEKNPHFWTPADVEYPVQLWEIPSPPPVLYYRGQVKRKENQGLIPMVGIVGTRYATEHGYRWTRRISKALVDNGFTVVSGMAAGIDGQAHQACLQEGGRTLAVLGTGVDRVYPPSHRQLYEQIQQQGLVLSEYPAGTRPDRGNFPARNRIIVGLSRAILVIEAPYKSGSLITARYAREFGRDLYSLPNSPEVEQAQGCLRLLHQGAGVIIEVEELLERLGARETVEPFKQLSLLEIPQNQPVVELEPQFAQVFAEVGVEPTSFDTIVRRSGLSTGEVSGILLQLELDGLVSQLPGMQYKKL